jgi:tripartite-type tricarboxylate transporter receptor subunit TctC
MPKIASSTNARLAAAAVVAVATAFMGALQAQTFPSKVLRIIVPFPPGGAADITSRILAEHMKQGLGQPVIVENRPGSGAVIGYELAARAAGDGHTMLNVFPSFVINPAVRPGLSYDPLRDFKAVAQTISLPMAIAVNPSVPAKSLEELIALARAKPGELAYGTPGPGTLQHVAGEMLKLAMNINIVHAPYQGAVPAVTAVAGGHLPMVLVNVAEIAPFARSGKVRVIVVTTPARAEALPEVPTMREAGYRELEATNWGGIVVPSATPPSVIARLNAELVRALQIPEVQEKFKAQGMSPAPGTPEQFGLLLQSETARYAKVVREAGVKAD